MRAARKAFTLVEILVVLGITGIVLALSSTVLMRAWLDFEVNEVRIELQEEALRATRLLEEDILEAKSVSASTTGQTLVLDYPAVSLLPASSGVTAPFPRPAVTYSIVNGDLLRSSGTVTVNATRGGYLAAGSRFYVNNRSVRCVLSLATTKAFDEQVVNNVDSTFQCRNR
jgi:prepilin-type N-terminal cleavage/methylation domain-containing protein